LSFKTTYPNDLLYSTNDVNIAFLTFTAGTTGFLGKYFQWSNLKNWEPSLCNIVLDEIFNISVPTSTIARKIQGNGLMGYWTSAKFFFSDILKTSSDKVLGKYEEQDHGLEKQYLHNVT
jgi:hypothetical protein